jgi:flagellar protein FlbD
MRRGTRVPRALPRRKERHNMIVLTKVSKEKFLLNHNQIECIETIPETRVVMMNHDYYLVQETIQDIIRKIAEYNAKVLDIHRQIAVTDKRK